MYVFLYDKYPGIGLLDMVSVNEISQTEKDKYHMIIAYMWNLKKWYKGTYLQNRNTVTDVENKLMVTRRKR